MGEDGVDIIASRSSAMDGFQEINLGDEASQMFHNTTQGLVFNRNYRASFKKLGNSSKTAAVAQLDDRKSPEQNWLDRIDDLMANDEYDKSYQYEDDDLLDDSTVGE